MQVIDSAYLAGVADSDGSFSISIRHRTRLTPNYISMFQLSWTFNPITKKIFDILIQTYGGSYLVQQPRKYNYKNSKSTIKYCLTGIKLKKFLEDVIPFLLLKKQQALNCLELINTVQFGKYGNGRPKPVELKNKHYKLYLNNKDLNTKNSGDRSANY